MKIRSYTLTYNEKRSINYQSVSVGQTVEYELADDEDAEEAFHVIRKMVVHRVREAAAEEIQEFEKK